MCTTAGFVDKDLFVTSSQVIKSHVVESQRTLVLLWLSFTEKQRTINHMITFNDSTSKFYKCWQ